ncbi:hypothetical protein [Methanobacterium congolense]|uniref:Uncharacterized protein n=1 Tax=Methanobacterium congolense TaxID=118062 RepID=A0A1D3L0U4_9EURY|nr:hypothetical protein [Methanobacterium congolense]SCG85284.1 putative protein [Methanobacterium congolense]
MSYLICERCGGYYELDVGESPDDFDRCQCGGKLRYSKTLANCNAFDSHETENIKTYKEEVDKELKLYQSIVQDEQNYRDQHLNNLFSSNFLTNSGFIVLTFTTIPLYYGFLYNNWIFYLIVVIVILLSLTFLFLKDMKNELRNSYLQKCFIFTGIIFGSITLYFLALLGDTEFLHSLFPKYGLGGSSTIYMLSVTVSAYFSFIFLKNSQMDEPTDFMNSMDKLILFCYYTFIFYLLMVIISGMMLVMLSPV